MGLLSRLRRLRRGPEVHPFDHTVEAATVRAQAEMIVGEIRQNLDRLDHVLVDLGAKEDHDA